MKWYTVKVFDNTNKHLYSFSVLANDIVEARQQAHREQKRCFPTTEPRFIEVEKGRV